MLLAEKLNCAACLVAEASDLLGPRCASRRLVRYKPNSAALFDAADTSMWLILTTSPASQPSTPTGLDGWMLAAAEKSRLRFMIELLPREALLSSGGAGSSLMKKG